jgi:hypothetical protein
MGPVRKALLWAGVAVWLASALPALAVEATLVADAHVNRALPDVNSGAISNLNVGAGYTALLQFDLSALPSGTTSSQVSRALLRLYCNRADATGQVSVQPVSGAWGEYSVTYATLPTLGSAAQVVPVNQAGAFVTVDVTALVQGWIADPTTNHGLALTAGTAAVQFDSKENDLTGHAALLDVMLVSVGPAGPAGPAGLAGPMGLPGPAGAAGLAGPMGLPGPAGATGAMGPPGVAGLTGPVGPTGPAGATGVMGLQGPQGPQGPQGQEGVAGPAGATGATGPAGARGLTGATGATGAQGATGVAGLVFRGDYSPNVTYGLNDAVSDQGSSYISLVAENLGNAPDLSATFWHVLAAQGAAGATGASGAAGARGAQGATGQQGATGATGAAGAAGMIYRGEWNSAAGYQQSDAVSFEGSTYLALSGSLGSQPDSSPTVWAVLAQKGSAGPSGPSGAAATVSIGTVTTGLAGSQAMVTNSGTASGAILNFTLPQGAAGTNGTGAGSGTAGGGVWSMYHAVSFSSNYYSVSNTNASATEDTTVLTWIPEGCTATALRVYSQQLNSIDVVLRQGTPGNMVPTTLACTAASGGTCTVTGSVSIDAGEFIDFGVSGEGGKAAGVWMALKCN